MADNREKNIESADKSKPVIVMLIVLAILVLVFTPIVTILALKAFMPADTTNPEIQNKKYSEVMLEAFKFNVAGTQGTRFAQVEVSLEVSDESLLPYFQDKTPENSKGMLKKIRAEVLDILVERDLDNLLSKSSRSSLRKEIQNPDKAERDA